MQSTCSFFLKALHNQNGTAEGEDVEVAGVPQTDGHEGGDEPHEFSDVMIHQVRPLKKNVEKETGWKFY